MEEIWKDIEGYEGRYKISNLGRVANSRNSFLKHILGKNGYYHVSLSKNNKSKKFYIHRLVGIYFIPNPLNLPQINHKDSDRKNFSIENLEWCDNSYNTKYAYDNNYRINGMTGKTLSSHHNAKEIIQLSLDGDFIKEWSCAAGVEKILKYNKSNICANLKGRQKSAYGFKWVYKS